MPELMLYYQEIFSSIQGESTDAGKPCVFVRLYGCNLNCSYCDQPQLLSEKKRMDVRRMVAKVMQYHIPYVCITGGEPFLQWDSVYPLVLELCSLGLDVSIETNGCNEIEADPYNRRFRYIMDVKCPSSGVSKHNVLDNLMRLQSKDEVKFVIKNKEDYKFAKQILLQYPTPAQILFSPCFDHNNPVIGQELVDWVVKDKIPNSRIQIQMHKILGVK